MAKVFTASICGQTLDADSNLHDSGKEGVGQEAIATAANSKRTILCFWRILRNITGLDVASSARLSSSESVLERFANRISSQESFAGFFKVAVHA